jgi:hypothetical protein
VGDNGTSFGPFQLHRGGALPANVPLGGAQQWATSPAGINYALDRIAGVARGKRGRAAVEAIVSQFERPADPAGEIQRALGHYGGATSSGALRGSPAVGAGPTGNRGLSPLLASVINSNNQILGLPPTQFPTLDSITGVTGPAAQPKQTATVAPRRSGKTIRFLEHFAAPYGLNVTATTNGRHVKGSYHYRGRAVDFSGGPSNMAALAEAALTHPQDFTEMFYSGPGSPGFYIKNGRVYPNSQLDRSVFDHHHDHVHLAK